VASGSQSRLVLAVLIDALQIVAWGVSSAETARLFAEAEDWIRSEDRVWPFSFVNVCEVLDLRPRDVRVYAAGWLSEPLVRERRKLVG
jgi:hypothetical protein